MGEVDPREAGAISYIIGNGAGKTRADRNGDARGKKTWRLLFLSSGEVGLAQHMNEGGKVVRAGQEVRLVDLPADAGKGHGVFEELHGFDSGSALSNAIKQAARAYHGTAGIAYIEAVAAQAEKMPRWVKEAVSGFVSNHLPEGAGGQAARVCARFGLIAVAGELATSSRITGWPKGAAHRAAAVAFGVWLEQRGGAGNEERDAVLAKVRAFFETHGDSRFTDMNLEHERATINRAGFRNRAPGGSQEFYVLPEAYK
jgi:putative DNA primase/helicase